MTKRVCKQCKKEFIINKHNQKTCSPKCKNDFDAVNFRKKHRKEMNKKAKDRRESIAHSETLCNGELVHFTYGRVSAYKRNYSISISDLCSLFNSQGGVCAISGIPLTLSKESDLTFANVDHDHKTKEVRYILHPSINLALGHLESCGVSHDLAVKKIKEMFDVTEDTFSD